MNAFDHNRLPPDKLAYNVKEAAYALGIGRTSLYRLISNGELQTFKWYGRTLLRRDDLQRAVDRASGRLAE